MPGAAPPRVIGRLARIAFLSCVAIPAWAQQPPRTGADSALAVADIPRADSLYYFEVRRRPRDPVIREALGRYLAMRGATKVAVVLLEEARMFGADPGRIGARLAPLYEALGDWRALLSLPGSPLTTAERKRAAWLADHPPAVRGDSTSVAIAGTVRGDTLGRITVRIGGRPVVAIVVARDVGVTIGARVAATAGTAFQADSTTIVIDSINIGAVRLSMVPATLDPKGGPTIIGLGALRQMTMTFDYDTKRAYFNRRGGTTRSYSLPLFRDQGQLRVAERRPVRWSSLAALIANVHAGGEAGPVTIDLKAGEVRIAY